MTDSSSPAPRPEEPATPSGEDGDDNNRFEPVRLRYRHDGWIPDKQLEFIQRLAECGCVDEACRAVGMSRDSAYALRRRPDAQAFRLAWAAAKDVMVERLDDAAMARAINGVPVPIFHNGEQVGERRHYDERLTMFLLRYRDPVRYGRWVDRCEARRHEDGPITALAFRIGRMLKAAWRQFDAALRGQPMPEPEPEPVHRGRPTTTTTTAAPELLDYRVIFVIFRGPGRQPPDHVMREKCRGRPPLLFACGRQRTMESIAPCSGGE